MNRKLIQIVNWSIIGLAMVSMFMGSLGWYIYYDRDLNREIDLWTSLFLGMQLFTVNSSFETAQIPVILNIARFTAPASLAGAIINGILMMTKNNYRYIRIRLFYRNHIIICGLTRRALALISDHQKNNRNEGIVIIDNNKDLQYLDEIQGRRIMFLKGLASSKRLLAKAGIRRAGHILLLDSDKMNLQVFRDINDISYGGKVTLHLKDLRTADIYKTLKKEIGFSDFHVITDTDILASCLIDLFSPDQYVSIKSPGDPSPHILIAGDSEFLVSIAKEACIMYHFANLKRIKIIFAVPDTENFSRILKWQLPNIHQAVDMSIISYQQVWQPKPELSKENIAVSFISCQKFSHGIALGKRFRQIFFDEIHSIEHPKIILIDNLSEDTEPACPEMISQLEPVYLNYFNGMDYFSVKTVIDDTAQYDIIAKFIHNSFSMKEVLDYRDAESAWQKLTDAGKDWNRWPARHFHIKLRVLGAKIVPHDDPTEEYDIDAVSKETRYLLARMEKNRWNAEKWLTGFLPGEYQQDKELEKKLKNNLKIHPALKPWEEISDEEKRKDTYAFNDIRLILKMAGMKIIAIPTK